MWVGLIPFFFIIRDVIHLRVYPPTLLVLMGRKKTGNL